MSFGFSSSKNEKLGEDNSEEKLNAAEFAAEFENKLIELD